MTAQTLLVGARDDPHLEAVLDALPRRRHVAVLCADTVDETVVEVTPQRIVLAGVDGTPITLLDGSRCWPRRIAPPGWEDDVLLGSRRASSLAARLTLLAAILRSPELQSVTRIDALFAAENKIVQYRAAQSLGIPTPTTLITRDVNRVTEMLGEPFIIKPLGPGHFRTATGEIYVVNSEQATATTLAGIDLLESPFIMQSYIEARAHLRVVTVGCSSWVARLDASGLPTDWRTATQAHDAFEETAGYEDVAASGIRLAQALGCGYTSQDWIVASTGTWFIDLNPSGQWLFLPKTLGTRVTQALAGWLAGEGPLW